MVIAIILFLLGCGIEQQENFEPVNEIVEETESETIADKTIVEENLTKPARPRCNDGTFYGHCSHQKPYYCLDGNILKKASFCGCAEHQTVSGEDCVSAFEITSLERTFEYTLRGKIDSISLKTYKELNDYLSEIPRTYICDPECPSSREIEIKIINNPEQKPYLKRLAEKIKGKTSDKQEQARIAISLVQSIPYADGERRRNALQGRYPYEVLYDSKGVCGEKSRLLSFILSELEFGSALFHYPEEKHMTAGIKCDVEHSYKKSGYCFVETVEPIMVTYVPENYIDIGELKSDPEILQVNDGESFNALEEYKDARELERINKIGLVLEAKDYAIWRDLMKKYGIHVRGRMFYR